MQLICAFVFAYAKSRFSHDVSLISDLRFSIIFTGNKYKLELMFMKHYAPNRCLYIKVAKLRTGVGSAEMSHLQNCSLKIYLKSNGGGGGSGWGGSGWM